MPFVPPTPLPLRTSQLHISRDTCEQKPPRTGNATCMSSKDASRVQPVNLTTQIYGPTEDVCTFGAECSLTEGCVETSPALDKLMGKYVFPMREENTTVFFDNSISDNSTLLVVFTTDRHGLVLDIVSVLKALHVRVHRIASSENDALRVILPRIEGELVSIRDLSLSVGNCVAFWITDEDSGEKIFDDGQRLDQLTACIKLELETPYPRPKPAFEDRWSRVSVQKNRRDRYTVFSVQTTDRPGLLAELSNAFNSIGIDVASATINTFSSRVENTFFVTKRGFKQPLEEEDLDRAMNCVLNGLLRVGEPGENETLWYQTRDGTAVLIAEAIFIDEVNNRELACFKFSEFETPNFRGRLPDAPYRPILLE